jgi:hypothetical protein
MELLPPMDPSELATKGDLAVLRAELRGEMVELRGEMRGEMAELRGEIAELRVWVTEALREQTNRILMFVLPTMLTSTLLAFAAARLGA